MEDVFIIATGYSLNNLTEEEKHYIKSKPTIAVGHYLIYWKKIGIIPDHFIFPGAPWDFPTRGVEPGGLYNACNEIIKETGFKTKFWASKENIDYLKGGEIPTDPNGQGTFNLVKCTNYPELKTGAIDIGETLEYHLSWATNLDEKFLYASSIATAINLAAVLYPGTAIKMLGNDGGRCGEYFYNEELGINEHMSTNLHYNMAFSNYPFIISKLKDTGNLIFNTNKKSWFTNYGNLEERLDEIAKTATIRDQSIIEPLRERLEARLFLLEFKSVLDNNY